MDAARNPPSSADCRRVPGDPIKAKQAELRSEVDAADARAANIRNSRTLVVVAAILWPICFPVLICVGCEHGTCHVDTLEFRAYEESKFAAMKRDEADALK